MTDRWAVLVAEERAALLGFLAAIDEDAWQRPTRCAGWTVQDVVSHLVDREVIAGRVYRGEVSELDAGRERLDDDNATGVKRWQALPGDAIRASLWQHGTAAQRVMDRLGEHEWERSIRVLGCARLREFARLHFLELAVHGSDATTALEAPLLWRTRAAALVEACAAAGVGSLARSAPPGERFLAVRIDGGETYAVGATGGWARSDASDAAATVETDAETFVLVTTGRLPVDAALERSTVAGDASFAERILSGWRAV